MAKKLTPQDEEDGKKKKKVKDALFESLKKRMGLKENDELKTADEYESVTDVLSTGHGELDRLLSPTFFEKHGKGGVPRGFLCEFFGPNSGGKSSLCLMIAAQLTQAGKKVFWVDAEHSFQSDWAKGHNVNLKNVIMCPEEDEDQNPLTAEGYFDLLEAAVSSGLFHLAVIDSQEALIPKQVLECNLDENAKIGEKARLMSRAIPRIISAAKKGNCTVIFINQIRNKIGVMYGSPETTPGGEALKFYCSLRLRISQVGGKERAIIRDGEEIGIRSNVLIKKSRFGPPFKETVLSIYYGNLKPHPLDLLIDSAISNKIIRARTKKNEEVQVYSLDLNDEAGKIKFPNIQKIEGMDELKTLLTSDVLLEISKKLIENKVILDPEVNFYVQEMKKHQDSIEGSEEDQAKSKASVNPEDE